MKGPSNEGMKLSKPEDLVGRWPSKRGTIESGFAAYAQCCADQQEEDRGGGRQDGDDLRGVCGRRCMQSPRAATR